MNIKFFYAPVFPSMGLTNAGRTGNNCSIDRELAMYAAGANFLGRLSSGHCVVEVTDDFVCPDGVNLCDPSKMNIDTHELNRILNVTA